MSSEIHIWTIQIAKWRVAKAQEIFFLDITAKSGHKAFAPHFRDVLAFKQGLVSEEDYTKLYLDRMYASQDTNWKAWRSLKNHPRIAFGCYCRAGTFCHRHLFTDLATTYLEQSGYEVVQEGELTA